MITICPTAFPHIWDNILSCADILSAIGLRAACRRFREEVDDRLFPAVVITAVPRHGKVDKSIFVSRPKPYTPYGLQLRAMWGGALVTIGPVMPWPGKHTENKGKHDGRRTRPNGKGGHNTQRNATLRNGKLRKNLPAKRPRRVPPHLDGEHLVPAWPRLVARATKKLSVVVGSPHATSIVGCPTSTRLVLHQPIYDWTITYPTLRLSGKRAREVVIVYPEHSTTSSAIDSPIVLRGNAQGRPKFTLTVVADEPQAIRFVAAGTNVPLPRDLFQFRTREEHKLLLSKKQWQLEMDISEYM
ncbi:hypothetical protein CC85DRAFT_303354 [Cutaneotrichosporon oleaginosum]|uniref:Uncharacterized protein n=1 Tax=Cutaneotrichosporon oleaginosum TaxID=879819 RepID=A0A0J0XJJ7_9TREE|nr:uncharacterized protein CC85DRAFT_303354 [Cutaneotrichosporon oleaginosum]KLT41280.1 hypothetical protein CC85DRAFT_303354 [Cutaneotrichosporon oleaginosum]TXT14030.1 hypothetical protein COLE_00223 [Cutaneotrichosporon oleaginosum]